MKWAELSYADRRVKCECSYVQECVGVHMSATAQECMQECLGLFGTAHNFAGACGIVQKCAQDNAGLGTSKQEYVGICRIAQECVCEIVQEFWAG